MSSRGQPDSVAEPQPEVRCRDPKTATVAIGSKVAVAAMGRCNIAMLDKPVYERRYCVRMADKTMTDITMVNIAMMGAMPVRTIGRVCRRGHKHSQGGDSD